VETFSSVIYKQTRVLNGRRHPRRF